MTSVYTRTKPDFTPGPLGRDASEIAKISAAPEGWIYTFTPVTHNISAATWSGGAATITCASHNFLIGEVVTIAGVTVNTGYNGSYTILDVPTANTFTYTVSNPGGAGTTTSATAAYTTSRHIEVVRAIRNLDIKQTAETDAGTIPTITAATFAATHTGGTMATIAVGAGGTGYGVSTNPVPCTVAAPTATGGGVTALVHGVANGSGVITSFVVDTAGTNYVDVPLITVLGTGTNAIATPTMTAYNVITAAVLTITLTASEALTVAGLPTISVTIGTNTRKFVYASGTGTTTLTFTYAVVAGDSALVTAVISGAAVDVSASYTGIGDYLAATGGTKWMSTVTFTAPDVDNVSVN